MGYTSMYKVIACSIFTPYVNHLSLDDSQYEFIYLEIHQHDHPQYLGKLIQDEIDHSKNYDKIIVLYGVCGGALLAIEAKDIPIVIIKVHDCMSILLGSKKKYEEITESSKSIAWSCYSLKKESKQNDNILKWKMMYDDETVNYLKSILIPNEIMYISMQLPQEKRFISNEKNIINGSLRFLSDILSLKSKDIIILSSNQKLKLSLDIEVIEIIK